MPRKRNILFVSAVSEIGGAEASLLATIGALDPDRYACTMVVPGPGGLADRLATLGVRTVFLPVRRFRKTRHPATLAAHAWAVWRTARKLAAWLRRERIDLVHANGDHAQLFAGPAARAAGIPCVWHARDLAELGRLGRWLYARAVRVLAISETVAAHLRRYGDPAKVTTLYNGLDGDAFGAAADGAAFRRACGFGPDAFVVGMAGQMVAWKRHALFLEAAAQIASERPDARFVVAGGDLFGGASNYANGLRARAHALGLGDRIVFTGHSPDMPSVLAGLDVLVHPADREPLGRVILEALSLGKPVVAVNAGGPAEIIRNGQDGVLVPPGDAGALARETVRLSRDREQAVRLGESGRARVRNAFSLRAHLEMLEKVYDSVLADRLLTVAYVVASFPSVTETFILREMTAMSRLGVAVRVFSLTRGGFPDAHPDARDFAERACYRPGSVSMAMAAGQLHALARWPGRYLRLLGLALWRGDPETGSRGRAVHRLFTAAAFARSARSAGVRRVHAHFLHATAEVGAMLAHLLGVPFSVSAHARDIFTSAPSVLSARMREAAFVAVCTGQGLARLRAACPDYPADRLALIRHGVFPDAFMPAPDGAREPVIAAVGRLVEKKGFAHLIEACRLLKDAGVSFRCVIVGDGPLRGPLGDRIDKLGLTGLVELAGEQDAAGVAALYRLARVMAIPSVPGPDGDLDGTPNVALEAMAAGLPVAASAVGGIPEAVTDGEQGLLVPPGDTVAWAGALRVLLTDAPLGRRLGAAGRARVLREFDMNRNAAPLAARFREGMENA